MEKNNKPYSDSSSLKLAFSTDFHSFTVIHHRFHGYFGSNKNWIAIPEVPGTLKTSVASDGKKTPLYSVNIKFRVAYDSEANRIELDKWTASRVLATYKSASGKDMVAGTKSSPLTFSYSKVEGFDGYECTLTGVQITPECFV